MNINEMSERQLKLALSKLDEEGKRCKNNKQRFDVAKRKQPIIERLEQIEAEKDRRRQEEAETNLFSINVKEG